MALSAIGIYTYFFYFASAFKHLDSVFLMESVLNILTNGIPSSNTVRTSFDAIAISSNPESAATICAFGFGSNFTHPYNILDNHAYFAIYPIAGMAALLGPELTFALLKSCAFVLLLFIPFVFLRMAGATILSSLAFVLCVAFYPGYSYSAIGDDYLDRLYMPFALLTLYLMHAILSNLSKFDRRLLWTFILLLILTSLFTERAAIMMIGLIVFCLCFFPSVRSNSLVRNNFLLIFVALIAYLCFYFGYVRVGTENGGSLLQSFQFSIDFNSFQMRSFLLVNLLFLGVFSLKSGIRYIILVVGSMLPQIFFGIGGAELNGWSTHYHAAYTPFLIFAASIGFVRAERFFSSKLGKISFSLCVSTYGLFIVSILNPLTGVFKYDDFSALKGGILGQIYRFYVEPENSYERLGPSFRRSIEDAIPEGAKVSTVEGVMPSLYKSRSLSLFPIGLDSADYLVASGNVSNGSVTSLYGAGLYYGDKKSEDFYKCLFDSRIKNNFFLYKSMPAFGLLILKRR